MISLRLDIGPLTIRLSLDRDTNKASDDSPPYIDTKYAADLGSPTGYGLLIRPDHIDGE